MHFCKHTEMFISTKTDKNYRKKIEYRAANDCVFKNIVDVHNRFMAVVYIWVAMAKKFEAIGLYCSIKGMYCSSYWKRCFFNN